MLLSKFIILLEKTMVNFLLESQKEFLKELLLFDLQKFYLWGIY